MFQDLFITSLFLLVLHLATKCYEFLPAIFSYCRMIFLIPLGLLFIATYAAEISYSKYQPSVQESDIRPYLSVHCSDDSMNVTLNHDWERFRPTMTRHLSQTMELAVLKIGNFDECSSTRHRREKQLRAFSKFDSCGIEKKTYGYGEKYSAQVVVNIAPELKPAHTHVFMFSVSCTILDKKLTQTTIQVRRHGRPLDTSGAALNLPLNSQLEIDIHPTLGLIDNSLQIHSYPKQCSLSNGGQIVNILDHGCPAYKGSTLLSSIYQNEAKQFTAGGTTIFFNLLGDGLPSESFDDTHTSIDVEFKCQVLFCSSDEAHRILGIPLCPSAAPCEESSSGIQPLVEAATASAVVARLPLPLRVNLTVSAADPREFRSVRQPAPGEFNELMPCGEPEDSTYLRYIVVGVFAFIFGAFITTAIFVLKPFRIDSRKLGCALSSATVSQSEHRTPTSYAHLESKQLMSDTTATATS